MGLAHVSFNFTRKIRSSILYVTNFYYPCDFSFTVLKFLRVLIYVSWETQFDGALIFFPSLISFTYYRTSYEWNHIAWTLLCKTSLKRYMLRKDFFDSAWGFWESSNHVPVICSFLLLNSTPLCDNTTVCVSVIHLSFLLLMDTWIVFSFCLLRVRWLWIFSYKSFCKHIFSFFLGKYRGRKMLGHREDVI